MPIYEFNLRLLWFLHMAGAHPAPGVGTTTTKPTTREALVAPEEFKNPSTFLQDSQWLEAVVASS